MKTRRPHPCAAVLSIALICLSSAPGLARAGGEDTDAYMMRKALAAEREKNGDSVDVSTFRVARQDDAVVSVTVFGTKNGRTVAYQVYPGAIDANAIVASAGGLAAALVAVPFTPLAVVVLGAFGTIGGVLGGPANPVGRIVTAAGLGVLGACAGFALPYFVGNDIRTRLTRSKTRPLAQRALKEMRAAGFALTSERQTPTAMSAHNGFFAAPRHDVAPNAPQKQPADAGGQVF